jgi:hypothetical protein
MSLIKSLIFFAKAAESKSEFSTLYGLSTKNLSVISLIKASISETLNLNYFIQISFAKNIFKFN